MRNRHTARLTVLGKSLHLLNPSLWLDQYLHYSLHTSIYREVGLQCKGHTYAHICPNITVDIIDMVSITQCTCGADSRAHKKDCSMNSWHRFLGRTLFPPPGSDVGTSHVPDGGLEPPGDEAAPRERGNALPAKKKKVEKMKVGDYVCIHSGLLGERHLPCHTVWDLGNHYQLYCPKGVILFLVVNWMYHPANALHSTTRLASGTKDLTSQSSMRCGCY